MSPSPTPESRMHGCSAHRRSYLPSADHQWGDVQEQGDALQPGGRIDYYDGSSEARIAWERRFARGGVSAIISSNSGIRADGVAVPGYATIDDDRTIPSWRRLRTGAPARLPLHHPASLSAGNATFPARSSSTFRLGRHRPAGPPLRLRSRRMTIPEIHDLVQAYARAARRARRRRGRHRDRGVQRLHPAPVPVERDQRPRR